MLLGLLAGTFFTLFLWCVIDSYIAADDEDLK